MTEQELDVLMKRVLVDSIKLDLEADIDDYAAAFVPSAQHQRQIKAMLKDPLGWSRKKARPVWKMVAQKVAIVLLVISVGFGTIMAASPTARAAFGRWIREWYETHITYRYTGENISDILPRYRMSALPEGYFEYQRGERESLTHIIYKNDNGERIRLCYVYMQQGAAFDFVTEGLEIIPIAVNGMAGELYLSPDLDVVDNTVTWINEKANLQFVVDAPLDRDDILHLAESVVLEEAAND